MTPRLNHYKADIVKVREVFGQVNYAEAFGNKRVNKKWGIFTENYYKIMKIYVPTYKNRPGCIKPKWINYRIRIVDMQKARRMEKV